MKTTLLIEGLYIIDRYIRYTTADNLADVYHIIESACQCVPTGDDDGGWFCDEWKEKTKKFLEVVK